MKRPLISGLLAAFLWVGAGCGDDASGLPHKDKVFTKMRGANTGGEEGTDVTGTCPAEETKKAACYGEVLVHCSDDGQPHAVECKKKLGTTTCTETDTTADCM